MSEDFLCLRNISKTFAGVRALSRADLSVKEGEVHTLVGENGCGKSTLIKIIAGVLQPDPGASIAIRGKVWKRLSAFDSLSQGIQVIYQDLSLFPNLTVAENISVSQYIQEKKPFVSRREMADIAREAMRMISVSLDLSTTVQELSIAKQQLVAICRSITRGARLIIMDEPTSSLGRRDVEYLLSVIRSLREEGITTLFVGHKLNEVFEIADRVTVLRDGRGMGTYEISQLNAAELIQLMTGRQIARAQLPGPRSEGAPILEVKELTKKGQFQGINLTLRPGEILGIAGLRGSGRTELALSIFGMNRADSGEIVVAGTPRRIRSVQDAMALGMGYVPEERLVQGLFMDHSVRSNLIVTVLDKLLGRLGLLDDRRTDGFVRSWISELGIKTPSADCPVKQLSGGNQQRVVLSKWMERAPRILIMDGPTVGIDVKAKEEIHEIMRTLASKGMGVIMISDEVAEIAQHTNRLLLMKSGRIVGEYETSRITEDGLLKELLYT
ncbi:MAG: sugar ABC transporter ATP-binding protein [Spirochaetia bacterium]|jgi:simple sugar transport system ATP-binding protein